MSDTPRTIAADKLGRTALAIEAMNMERELSAANARIATLSCIAGAAEEKYDTVLSVLAWENVPQDKMDGNEAARAVRALILHGVQRMWIPIATAPKDGKSGKFLVTNNIAARTSFGTMSHLWLVDMVHVETPDVFAFDDCGNKVRSLSHWMPLHTSPQ